MWIAPIVTISSTRRKSEPKRRQTWLGTGGQSNRDWKTPRRAGPARGAAPDEAGLGGYLVHMAALEIVPF